MRRRKNARMSECRESHGPKVRRNDIGEGRLLNRCGELAVWLPGVDGSLLFLQILVWENKGARALRDASRANVLFLVMFPFISSLRGFAWRASAFSCAVFRCGSNGGLVVRGGIRLTVWLWVVVVV